MLLLRHFLKGIKIIYSIVSRSSQGILLEAGHKKVNQMINENEISMEKGAEKLGLSPEVFREELKEYPKTQV